MADLLAAHQSVMAELQSSPRKLSSPRACQDKSTPHIDPNFKLEKLPPREELLKGIAEGVHLNHVETAHDASAPRIEPDVVIKPSPHNQLMQEVRAVGTHHAAMEELKQVGKMNFLENAHEGGLPLRHVTTVDKAAPVIAPDAHMVPDTHGQLLKEVMQHPPLQHVQPGQQHDTSGPVLQPGVGLDTRPDPRAALLEEVRSGHVQLHHVQEVADHSAPAVSKTAAMRVVPNA